MNIFKHISKNPPNQEEIMEIARRQGKSVEEIKRDIAHALKDLQYTQAEISNTITRYNYHVFPDDRVRIGDYGRKNEIDRTFLCHDQAHICSGYPIEDMALVTGFGPTNPPTAGTLSVISRLLNIQQKTGIYCHVIISELGAMNSRKKSLRYLMDMAARFKDFIGALGFDHTRGELRTHNYLDFLRTFTLASSVLKLHDFEENKECTEEIYKRLNIQGHDFSTMVDKTFTVSDILMPLLRDRKKLVVVTAGLEEHYYPRLAGVVLERMKDPKLGLDDLVSHGPRICAMYGRIIEGLFPYVKMSKSIPESSINIGDSEKEIRMRIMECSDRNEPVILQMMELTCDWEAGKIAYAGKCFENRKVSYSNWKELKEQYFEFFIRIKRLWEKTASTTRPGIRESIFFRESFPVTTTPTGGEVRNQPLGIE